MSVIMIKKYDLSGQYTNQAEKERIISMIESFRTQINDFDPELNLLNGKKLQYTDNKVVRFLKEGIKDLNRGAPKTRYTIINFPDEDLAVKAAVVVSLMAEGVLQLRNQISYSDSGFTMDMFNKTGGYQGWAGFFLQTYMQDKRDFKTGLIANTANSGFYGISSEFGYFF